MSVVQVAHDIPGRLRLRLPAGTGAPDVTEALAAEPGVVASRWSPRTRSLLVLYDPERATRDTIGAAVARATGLEPPAASPGADPAVPGETFALGVRAMAGDVDRGVQHATRGLLSLGSLLPAALTAWALVEIVRGRAAPLAWSSALWYAHGLFRDYQVPATKD
jgi:Heavy metal associated domain 2